MNFLKGTFAIVAWFAIIFGLVVLGISVMYTGIDLAVATLPWLLMVTKIGMAVCVIILLPLSVIARARIIAGAGFYLISFVFGATLCFCGLLITYLYLGVPGVVIGLLLAGIGVVPIAAIGALLHADWFAIAELMWCLALTLITRTLGVYLIAKGESDRPTFGGVSFR